MPRLLVLPPTELVKELLRPDASLVLKHPDVQVVIPRDDYLTVAEVLEKHIELLRSQVGQDSAETIREQARRSLSKLLPATSDLYAHLEAEARKRTKDHPAWRAVALALACNVDIYTSDPTLFGCGAAVWSPEALHATLEPWVAGEGRRGPAARTASMPKPSWYAFVEQGKPIGEPVEIPLAAWVHGTTGETLERGLRFEAVGDHSEAWRCYLAGASSGDPEVVPTACYLLGRLANRLGIGEWADSWYRSAISYEHRDVRAAASLQLARALIKQGESESRGEAERLLRTCWEARHPLFSGSAALELAALVGSGDRMLEAREILLEASAWDGAESRFMAADTMRRMFGTNDPEAVQLAYERAEASADSQWGSASANNLGIYLRQLGRYPAAESAFRRAIASGVDENVEAATRNLYATLIVEERLDDARIVHAQFRPAEVGTIQEAVTELIDRAGLLAAVGRLDVALEAMLELELVAPDERPFVPWVWLRVEQRRLYMDDQEIASEGTVAQALIEIAHRLEAAGREQDGANLLRDAVELKVISSLDAMLATQTRPAEAEVRRCLGNTSIYSLGEPAGDLSVPGQGTESDLLHFTVDDSAGIERVLLPLFTRPEFLQTALVRNPDWQTFKILEIEGQPLLDNVDSDVTIVINPWTILEFLFPYQPPSPTELKL